MRVVWVVSTFTIPPDLFVNLDETGIRFFPARKMTWGPKGASQIDVHNVDDKRQFTATPVISASGKVAGRVQLIWEGKTKLSTPKPDVVQQYAGSLTHTFSPSHWSTTSTVLELVANLYADYVLPTMRLLHVDPRHQH